ncbi:hypothetical protein BJ944DRAFT_281646 [Cunninghamella echinulata]|nr:hypothetical protein BJ944DRAFT_281646 [Cunninghamella echinulata]
MKVIINERDQDNEKDGVFQFAAGLQDRYDFKKGDVLAIFAPNSIDYVFPVLGTVAANGAVSPTNPRYSVNELTHQLKLSKAKILLAHPENIDIALKAAENVGIPKSNILLFGNKSINGVLPYRDVLMKDRRATLVPLTPEEIRSKPCFLCFSSGTTGLSKGVMTSQYNSITTTIQYLTLDEYNFPHVKEKSAINFLPLFHMYALFVVLEVSLRRGSPVYMMAQFDLLEYMAAVQKYRINYAWLVPPVILLLAKDPRVKNYDLSSLKIVFCAAAPLSKELSEQFGARFNSVAVIQGYGMTETSPIVTIEVAKESVPGSCGVVLPNCTVRLVKEDGSDAKKGETGELWARGPNMMLGYIDNPEATANTIDKDGWLHTGDIAKVDDQGRFYIVDRIKELIKYKGFQVPPAELDGILIKSPIVTDCAVVGVYDEKEATEIPRAYVVLKPGVEANDKTANEIMQYVKSRVASFKQIREIRFTDTIPKTASGKVLRRVLKDQIKQEQEQQSNKSKL